MATTIDETAVKTVLDKYAAIATQGDSETPCMYYYTGEYGWSAYVLNSSTSAYKWVHSSDEAIAVASDDGTDLILETTEDSTDDDYVAYTVSDYVASAESMTTEPYATYLKWRAGYTKDDDTGETVWTDYTTDIYDYIIGCQGFNLYEDFLDSLDDDGDDDTTSTTGFRELIDINRFLRVDEGVEALEFFTVWYGDQTTKNYQLFYNYLKTKYKPYPGAIGSIVYGDFDTYNLPTPDNLWPCDGSTITNERAVPQLYNTTAPDYSGKVLASTSTSYSDGDTTGATSITLTSANIPTLSGTVTVRPYGSVSITDPGHTHYYTSYFRYMYYVSRSSSDISSNSARDSSATSTSNYSDAIETGADDRYYFHWKHASISGSSAVSSTTGVTATFSGTTKTIVSTINSGSDNTAISTYQPTTFKQAYVIIY